MSEGSASYRMTLACGRLLMLDEINALTSRWNEALAASQTDEQTFQTISAPGATWAPSSAAPSFKTPPTFADYRSNTAAKAPATTMASGRGPYSAATTTTGRRDISTIISRPRADAPAPARATAG